VIEVIVGGVLVFSKTVIFTVSIAEAQLLSVTLNV
jgi:hypothetical protein